jgi:AcrR family transcriptional regulator
VSERHRAVALARHYRETEGLSVAQIAERVGRSPATIRSYFYDPKGMRARRVKQTYRGVCETCGAATSGAGPGQARARCARCNGQSTLQWPKERIEAALRAWHDRYGWPVKSTDLSVSYSSTQAPRDGGVRLRRLQEGWDGGRWPALSVVQ